MLHCNLTAEEHDLHAGCGLMVAPHYILAKRQKKLSYMFVAHNNGTNTNLLHVHCNSKLQKNNMTCMLVVA